MARSHHHHKSRTVEKAKQGASIGRSTGVPGAGAVLGATGAVAGGAETVVITGAKTATLPERAAASGVETSSGFVRQHSSGGVLVSSLVLLMLATWKPYWKPLMDTAWNNTPLKTEFPHSMIVGGVVFAIILAMIANSSNEGHTIIVWTLVAMWLLYLIFNGVPTLNSVFTWFGVPKSQLGNPPTEKVTEGGFNATPGQQH